MEREDKEWLLKNEKGELAVDEFKGKGDSLVEPQSLRNKKSFLLDIPVLNCYYKSRNIQVRQRDLTIFYKLVKMSNVSFDQNDPEHVDILTNLYQLVFQKQPESVLNDIVWEQLGFQNSKPGSDFRGGGLLSLTALYHLCSKEIAMVNDFMEFFKQKGNFLFACVVINSVYFLKCFFHFGVFRGYSKERDNKRTCSRLALKYFISLDEEGSWEQALNAFNEIIRVYNKKLYLYWKNSCLNDDRITIMDFKVVDDEIQRIFISCFENMAMMHNVNKRNSLSKFLTYFERFKVEKIVKV